MKYFVIGLLLLLFGILNLSAQTIIINEVASSNALYYDEDGDTPDWLELHNYGSEAISMNGWSLSDDLNNLTKWTFPNITLSPDQYLLLWASSKNRSSQLVSRTLINQGDIFNYLIPTAEPNSNWKALNFNDNTWPKGPTGFGYADGDDATIIPNGTLSVYLRKKFTIENLHTISSLILDMDYDDAFVAYINGIEVARANISGSPPTYNAPTISYTEAQIYAGGAPERFLIKDFKSILKEDENILTIQAHNTDANSSDFTVIPFLSAVFSAPTNLGITPPDILGFTTSYLHTNFKISSTSETLILTNNFGTIVNQITAENIPPDTTIGVSVNSGTIVSYIETTPGYQNSSKEYLGAVQSEVIFSNQGGLIDSAISLVLSGNTSQEIIRYELGGDVPTESSSVYTNPIQINTNISVRAKIFLENYLPSKVFTKGYLIHTNHELDVVFLTTDPENLFNGDTGIYVFGPNGSYDNNVPYYGANFWEDWERPIHFSFYENKTNTIVEFNGGVKIFGGWSRGQNDQRSLALFARGKYGDSKFEHSFFDQLNYNDFQALVLRNSGQDWLKSSMKDIMLTSLMRGSGLDFQEHNPVATYLNGDYWGMYNLREKVNEHMLASKHNINAEDITLLSDNAEEIEGSNAEYNELINYIKLTDLSIDANFEYVKQQIDIRSYALYQATNIFINNTDWPGNNIKFWKHPEGKWRWIMFDTDFGFGPFWNTRNYWEDTLSFALDENGLYWFNPSWSTLLFRRLMTNISFRNMFINQYADELNSRFLPNNVNAHINDIYKVIQPETQTHYELWGSDVSAVNYYVDEMKVFAENRPSIAKNHIKSKFNLPHYHPITITNQNISKGFVKVNDHLKIQNSSWIGDYFETVPIQLTAIPEAGFEFSHWNGAISSTNKTITLNLTEAIEVIPNFKVSTSVYPIVINEINYRSSNDFNADDWVELYNPNTFSIDLSDWSLKDDDDTHVYKIPVGTTIHPNSYLVVVKDKKDFSTVFPEITNYIGDLGFGFGTADAVRLFNENNVLQDEVVYFSNTPWSECANETGNTLELITPDLDNTLPASWNCINTNGSPNAINNASLSIDKVLTTPITIYPNPVKNTLYITGLENQFKIHVYTIVGQEIFSSKNQHKVNVNQLKKGVYFIKIIENRKSTLFKFIKN
ncbi:MAG: hypothetical protein ACJAQX_001151 [Polaribacter sp.]|jgi:hypothetical protein